MDKILAKTFQKVMGQGEKVAPVKSIKLKVKFQKPDKKKEARVKKALDKKDK